MSLLADPGKSPFLFRLRAAWGLLRGKSTAHRISCGAHLTFHGDGGSAGNVYVEGTGTEACTVVFPEGDGGNTVVGS